MKIQQLPNQHLLEALFLQSPNVIAITNADFNNLHFEYVNPAFLDMTGYALDEVIGSSPYILQGPETKRDMTKKLKEHCLRGEHFRGDNINYKKDGTSYHVGWTVSPIKDKNGNITNYISTQKDITQIKDNENKCIEDERLDALEKISSGLTHEINSSLTTCKGGLEMLNYEIENIKDMELKEHLTYDLKQVKKSISNISYITDSLHYLTSNNLTNLEQCNINSIILDSIEPFKQKIESITSCRLNGLSIFENLNTNEQFEIEANRDSLKHLFMIIIDNALDELIKKHDVSLNTFDIYIKKESSDIVIDFTDNAGGIDKKLHNKIFEPLVNQKELGGLGIGLYIAKNIVNRHNGIIELKSNTPFTTFTIKLNSI